MPKAIQLKVKNEILAAESDRWVQRSSKRSLQGSKLGKNTVQEGDPNMVGRSINVCILKQT